MRRLAALGCLLLTLFLTGCTGETFTPNADVKPAGSELTVWFVSDLHLLSEELTDQSPEFLTMIARGDGKTAHYSQEIGQALVWQITSLSEEKRPDVLLAAGDLTFNGEKLSHETVAGLFEEIEAAGVPVLTLMKNHLPATIELTLTSLVMSSIFGILLGVVCALKKGTALDPLLSVVGMVGVAIPQFLLGLI